MEARQERNQIDRKESKMLRQKILIQAIGHKTGASLSREMQAQGNSINYREALEATKAVKKMRLTKKEASDYKMLWHICQGYKYDIDVPSPAQKNIPELAKHIIYREWPENTSRIGYWKFCSFLNRFGFENPRLVIAILDAGRIITWERIADLNQVGPNPRLLKS